MIVWDDKNNRFVASFHYRRAPERFFMERKENDHEDRLGGFRRESDWDANSSYWMDHNECLERS